MVALYPRALSGSRNATAQEPILFTLRQEETKASGFAGGTEPELAKLGSDEGLGGLFCTGACYTIEGIPFFGENVF